MIFDGLKIYRKTVDEDNIQLIRINKITIVKTLLEVIRHSIYSIKLVFWYSNLFQILTYSILGLLRINII